MKYISVYYKEIPRHYLCIMFSNETIEVVRPMESECSELACFLSKYSDEYKNVEQGIRCYQKSKKLFYGLKKLIPDNKSYLKNYDSALEALEVDTNRIHVNIFKVLPEIKNEHYYEV
ncbi:hypothetical protein D9V86_06275 [Bacteroidetes/Chlorobi group bacterium ChocPot_Mid]|nr:MAG: hypothetical protein D9V86_06275 [Bacteroidetes/Chlorobi group bacterium ChocPot_Mid]